MLRISRKMYNYLLPVIRNKLYARYCNRLLTQYFYIGDDIDYDIKLRCKYL